MIASGTLPEACNDTTPAEAELLRKQFAGRKGSSSRRMKKQIKLLAYK